MQETLNVTTILSLDVVKPYSKMKSRTIPSDVEHEVNMLRYAAACVKVLGAWPYNSVTGEVEKCWFVYSLLVACVQIAGFTVYATGMELPPGHEIIGSSTLLFFCMVIFYLQGVGITWIALCQRKITRQFFLRWQNVVSMLPISAALKRRSIATFICSIILTASFLILNGFGSELLFNQADIFTETKNKSDALQDETPVVFTITTIIASAILSNYISVACFFMCCLSCLTLIFQTINKKIQNALNAGTIEAVGIEKAGNSLQDLLASHMNARQLVDECSALFGKQMAVVFAGCAFQSVAGLYFLISIKVHPATLIVMIQAVIVQQLIMIYSAHLSAILSDTAHDIDTDLSNYMVSGGDNTDDTRQRKKLIKRFLAKNMSSTISINIYGFFVLDRSAILSFYSILATYVIILFQMSPSS